MNFKVLSSTALLLAIVFTAFAEDKPTPNQPLFEAEKLLNSEKTRSKGITELAKFAREKKDSSEKFEAKALLSETYRNEKKFDKALETVSDCSDFDKISKNSTFPYKSSYLKAFLEAAHCKAVDKDKPAVRESFKMLDYSENNTEGIDKARSQYKYGAVLFDLNEFGKAEIYLRKAIETAEAYLREKKGKVSEGDALLANGSKGYKQLKPKIDELLFLVSVELLKKEYGEGYALYVKMRTYYGRGDFHEAFIAAKDLKDGFPEEIYGEGGRFYWCKMLIQNEYGGDLKDKTLPSGIKEIMKFLEDKPYGAYAGECWMELGRSSLEEKWDADESAKYWDKALNWFRTIKERKKIVELYPMPEKLKKVAITDASFSPLNEWYLTEYRPPLAGEIDVANPNYMNECLKKCLFMSGFFFMMNGDAGKAKACFEEMKDSDANLAMLESKNFPNAFRRLKASAETGFMVFPPEEKKYLKGRNKLRMMYAELKYMMEMFRDARRFFQEIVDDPKSTIEEKAIAYIGIGNCSDMTVMPQTKEARLKEVEYYKKALALADKTPIAGNALVCIGNYLQGSTMTADMGNEYFEEYIRKYPNGRYIELALHRLADAYSWQGKIPQAKELLERLKAINPDSLFVKHLSQILKKDDNNKKGEKL